ncbi:MAG: hypothetical protein ACOC04_06440, partial [Halothece sp.]
METRIFLCNGDRKFHTKAGTILNKQLPDIIKSEINSGKPYLINGWSGGNSKSIEVGDRAYLQRSGDQEARGFIAAGYVVAAPKDEQLRRLNSDYSDLSEA